ncbi:CotY/CotZ family spore coat protein [Lederbergia lenta]|uniref:Spore coat protein Z n=1 Tax=Lederbergia lenta TaxID=1467 RepID=A0A2X4WE43_LEDLE|nr:CotY/CotZ family spore coat protein [Lederbergia lenta]MCM3113458.1 CotY/CotZ family spore coat protein [Lederbergia lenta]MEC2326698.1 CotY/CotZ family spore coat protein [Lederbergia lenta]SQI61461.1 spore coat protein Z [Lederbergia lenta]
MGCSKYKKHRNDYDDYYDEYEDDSYCYKYYHYEHEKDKSKDCEMDHRNEFCLEETLEAILRAQRKAQKDQECKTSCKESIKQLVGESHKTKNNTIPFILYNTNSEPFKASGVTTLTCSTKHKKFTCTNSFVFKIKDLKDHCAVLELLIFKTDKKCSNNPHKKCSCKDICSPCCQIDHKNVDDLVSTGICINVDLSCFCAITCLPAVYLKCH